MPRMFKLNLQINISAEEATILLDYLKATEHKRGAIGHILSDKAQDMVEDLMAKATMYHDKKGRA
jgi:hypothetical protein